MHVLASGNFPEDREDMAHAQDLEVFSALGR